MKSFVLPFVILSTFASLAVAHVGSPNVFFEGRAGDYWVYAVVRPPITLPGSGQISVQVRDSDIHAISLLPVLWPAGNKASPLPVPAARVPGETNLWTAELWFLRPGSYTVRINVEGERGTGEASVPVNALGIANQQMNPRLRIAFIVVGSFLFLSAIWIVRVLARDACLAPREQPAVLNRKRATCAAAIATVILVAGVSAGAARWHKMDLGYRTKGVLKPEPVMAQVREETNRLMLALRQADQSLSLPSWGSLVPDHGKLMHLFLIREPALDVFAHLHPIRQDARSFALEMPALPGGRYQLYGDVTFENGIEQTLIANLSLPQPKAESLNLPPLATNLAGQVICGFPSRLGSSPGAATLDMDDSWHVDPVKVAESPGPASLKFPGGGLISPLMGGYTLLFENATEVSEGRAKSLRFAAFGPEGSEVPLQPYLGMAGHAVVRRADGLVFAHLHPMGSFSMASQEAFRQSDAANRSPPMGGSSGETPSNRVSFPFQFPKPGPYRLWIQVRIAGQVLTGIYGLEVKQGA